MRSDRVSSEMAISVVGTDTLGTVFLVEGKTILVSRQGAKIVLGRALVPNQEITVRCNETTKEAVARVVGQIGQNENGYFYSIEFLDPETDLWGIEFPPLAEGEGAVGRVVLECCRCHTRELTYLDESELEVLETNSSLARYCKRCKDDAVWKKSSVKEGVPEPVPSVDAATADPAPAPAPVRTKDMRRERRREVRVSACIRSFEFGDDIVKSRNASRGGLSFESTRQYFKGWKIEIAIPYSPSGGNIFLPGQIVRAHMAPAGELNVYGVAYTQAA